MGEDTDNLVESTATLRDMIKGITGFDIMKDEETFKSIYEIVVGIGEKWQDLSDIQQAGLLEKLAGKTQANALASALNNIDTLKEAYNSAEESAGSAMREQAHFEEGIQYSINQFNASVEALSHTLIDSGVLKWFIDLGTTGVEALDKLAQKLTMFPALITGITAAFSFVKGKNFFEAPVDAIADRTSAIQRYTASTTHYGRGDYARSFIGNIFGSAGVSNNQLNANSIINTLQKNGVDFGTYQPTIEELQAVSQQLGIVGDDAAQTAQQMIILGQVSGQAGQQGQASFKGLGNLLKSIGKTAASIGATMLISFAVNEAFKAYDRYINKYDNSKRNMEEANTSIENKRKELADLQNDYDKIQDRLTQINSMGGAKLAKDGEKEKLEAQSQELERQIALKEASLRLDARKAYDESNELMKSTVEAHDSIDVAALKAGESRADYVRSRDLRGVSSNAKTRMGIRQAVPAELEYYRALVEERKNLDKQLDGLSKDENGKYSKELADANGDAINDLNIKIETNTKLTDESRESLIEWSNTLSTAADDIKGYEDFGHILTEDDKATIALAESTKSAIDAMADELIAGDKVSESQEKLKNSVVKTSEQLSAQKTTVDGLISTYNELYSLATRGDGLDVVLDDEQLKKYGNALEYVNGNYKLNTEKLFELAEAHNKEQIALMKHDKEMANMQYLKNARDIEVYNNMLKDGEKILSDGTSIKKRIADLRNENLAIIEQNKVADYQISQLENVTSAYQKWLAVSGQETDAKAFTGVQDASKSILDLLEKGKIGLDSYKMAVDFVIPEDISSQGEVAIQKYVKNLQKYFTEDRTGVDKFLEKSSYFTRGEKGYELQEGTSVADIAKDMGWTIEVTRAMIDQLETFGGEFKWNIEGMFSDTDKLVHYQEELAKINEEKDKFNLNDLSEADSERLDELNIQADTLLKKINEVQGAISKTTFDEATETINSNGGIQQLYQTYSWMKDK
ncbi:MAG: hypothetical protein J5965_10820, partial [Aeriscardovia sp.]|nr:hypothetical protein [Aeriscardovia sp.]